MVKLPREKFVSGDGWAATYIFNGIDYTTGYVMSSEIRRQPNIKATDGDPLQYPTIGKSFADNKTTVILSLTGTQTRDLGRGGWLDLQVIQSGGQPLTLIQQELTAQGDVTK